MTVLGLAWARAILHTCSRSFSVDDDDTERERASSYTSAFEDFNAAVCSPPLNSSSSITHTQQSTQNCKGSIESHENRFPSYFKKRILDDESQQERERERERERV